MRKCRRTSQRRTKPAYRLPPEQLALIPLVAANPNLNARALSRLLAISEASLTAIFDNPDAMSCVAALRALHQKLCPGEWPSQRIVADVLAEVSEEYRNLINGDFDHE